MRKNVVRRVFAGGKQMTQGAGSKILVVDDDPALLQAMVRILERAGYTVIPAATGSEGLRLASETLPDLMIVDVILPDIDGREICRHVKANPALIATETILISSIYTSPEEQAEGLMAGVCEYIARPMANREFLARVEARLRDKHNKDDLRRASVAAMTKTEEKEDGPNEIRLLLFVQDDTACRKYLEVLSVLGVKVFVSPSFFHLSEELRRQTYHGLLFDMPTKMRALKENKTEVYRLAEKFPVAHLQRDRQTDTVRCFHAGWQAGRTLDDFILQRCQGGVPQKISASTRKELHLPVLVFRHGESKRPERAITSNISAGGCFIISGRSWTTGHEIFLAFPELQDKERIRAQIRSVMPWGMGHEIPGIGVRFLELSPSQTTELESLCRLTDGAA